MPCCSTTLAIKTAMAAAGPLTASGVPPNSAHTMPAMIAVIRPMPGATPDASAIARDSGTATQATVNPATKSARRCCRDSRAAHSGRSFRTPRSIRRLFPEASINPSPYSRLRASPPDDCDHCLQHNLLDSGHNDARQCRMSRCCRVAFSSYRSVDRLDVLYRVMPNVIYILGALVVLWLLVPYIQPKKKPFDWSQRHSRWSRWRARRAFLNR